VPMAQSSGHLRPRDPSGTHRGGDADLPLRRRRTVADHRLRICDSCHPWPDRMGTPRGSTFAIRVVKALDLPRSYGECERRQRRKAIWGSVRTGSTTTAAWQGRCRPRDLRSPTNLRPTTARPRAGVGGNPFGLKPFTGDRRQNGRYDIPAGGSLVMRYRVFIHHGNPSQAGVAEAYRRFVAPN
jgi:hypothetical protein